MSSLPTFDMIDATLSQLEQALRVCGLPLTLRSDIYEKIGERAWHDIYRVTLPHQAQPLIVRLRKAYAYTDHADNWHAEYVSTSLYYKQANRASSHICPETFLYHVSEEITCTVESYMGKKLDLATLDPPLARRLGRQIGSMMCQMHQKKTHIKGTGELAWDGANLYGKLPPRHPLLAQKIEQSYKENILMALSEQIPSFDHHHAQQKLAAALTLRTTDEPTVLINRDITPEHLTIQPGNRIGIIDPYPYLGNGTRFAAWFIHCYRFLLPAYAPTPRYRLKRYDKHALILAEIVTGFEKGYIQGDDVLARHIAAERWMWTLEQAYDDLERLQSGPLTPAQQAKHGAPDVIRRRLRQALRTLEKLAF